jgi:hypothetical protein
MTKGLLVKYYNMAMTNISISRHFCFLSPMENHATNGPLCEGEQKDGTRSTALVNRPESLKKREADTNIDIIEPRRTRGIHVDFKYLSDLFLDE